MINQFTATYLKLCKLPVIGQEALLDDGLLLRETLCAVLYFMATEAAEWKWTKRELCNTLRKLAGKMRLVADQCDRISSGYPAQSQEHA